MNAFKFDDIKSRNNEIFTSKEKDILEKIQKFFSADSKYIDTMLQIINRESDISIRVLDWFVANYCKKNGTCYKIKVNGVENIFNVHSEYENQLNGYSKKYFDPFCRAKKVAYTYRNNDGSKQITFESSIAQLNFFQWAIRYKVINYVRAHLQEIEEDMRRTSKQNKEKKLAALEEAANADDDEDEDVRNDDPDPIICSSDTINSVHISPAVAAKKSSNGKSDSDARSRRQQLSKSIYEHGIKKSNIPIKLDFD